MSALAEGDATSAMFDVMIAKAAPASGKTAVDLPDAEEDDGHELQPDEHAAESPERLGDVRRHRGDDRGCRHERQNRGHRQSRPRRPEGGGR